METKFCEICGEDMGSMSPEAYEKAHRHCDFEDCVDGCAACQEERSRLDAADRLYQAQYAYACGYHD